MDFRRLFISGGLDWIFDLVLCVPGEGRVSRFPRG